MGANTRVGPGSTARWPQPLLDGDFQRVPADAGHRRPPFPIHGAEHLQNRPGAQPQHVAQIMRAVADDPQALASL